jgi:hypothetical protein
LAPERKACFQAKGPLHNTISTRNESSAGLGGRICPVVKSLHYLSNNHTYQYIEMVIAQILHWLRLSFCHEAL